jgi:L-fuculose-phosphate aldolase
VLTRELGRDLAGTLGPARAAFLVNHGIVAVGKTLQAATVAAVLLERACQQQLLTASAGGWPSWSPPAEALAKRDHIYNDRAVDAVWDYLVRQLPGSAS